MIAPRRLFASRLTRPPQALSGGNYRDRFEGPDRDQIVIARNDGVGARRQRTGQHVIVIGVARDGARQCRRMHHADERKLLGDEFFDRAPGPRNPLGEFRPAENFLKFGHQRGAGMEGDFPGAARGEEFAWRSTPKQRGHHDVGVSDDSQARRAARRVRP